jgi:hypothetical protein
MLYRKAPPQPTRLLLRVVAAAGAGAVLGVMACSSSDSQGVVPIGGGSVDGSAFEGGHDGAVGVTTNPEGGDEHVVNGVVPNPDASDDHVVSGAVDACCGVVPLDGGEDGPVGVVVHPDGGGD